MSPWQKLQLYCKLPASSLQWLGSLLVIASYLVVGVQPASSNPLQTPDRPDDVTPGVFVFTGEMSDRRENHTVTLLQDGEVLVAGGISDTGRNCDLYNPATGEWRATGGLRKMRANHTATLLPDGRVLVAGGRYSGMEDWEYRDSSELYDPIRGVWSYTGDLNAARSHHTATLLLNGKVLVAGGYADGWAHLSSAEVYDPATGAWSTTGSMLAAHFDHIALRLMDGRVLLLDRGSAEIYDPNTGLWSAANSPLAQRTDFSATLLQDGRVLVAGGYDQDGLRTAEIYDPQSGNWTMTGSMVAAHSGHTATLLQDGTVLITGINSDSDEYGLEPGAEVYDPQDGTWRRVGDPFFARSNHSAILLNDGSVLVLGGEQCCTTWLTATELYKPAQGPWSLTGSLNFERSGHTSTLLNNGKVLVAGGLSFDGSVSTHHSSAELFDPLTGNWTLTGSMSGSRYGHTATLLLDGKVLVAGGGRILPGNNFIELSSAELYDPQLGTWSPTGGMAIARAFHTATRLQDGRVLVVKGASAELYDPQTGLWSAAGTLVAPRSRHAAVLLNDGRVLVIGGDSSSGGFLGSCELYDPAQNSWQVTGSMAEARMEPAVSILANGHVLAAGGWSDFNYQRASAEVYDPATGTWSAASSLPENTVRSAAVLLQSGAPLVIGGDSRNSSGWKKIMGQSMIYNSTIDAWVSSGRLFFARHNHTATLLSDGRVLVAGGDEGDRTSSSAEIYQPEPRLAVSPREINLHLPPEIVATRPITLTNSGGSDLSWSLVEDPPRDWLSVPPGGMVGYGITQTLQMEVDTAGLPWGETYTTTLRLTSNAANLPQVAIPVSVQVSSHIWLPLAQSSGYLQRFDYTGKCVSRLVGEVYITWCVPQINVLQNQSLQVFTTWSVDYYNPNIHCVWKHPDGGNSGMYLTDTLGNVYDHYIVGEAAEDYVCIHNDETVRGWFLFPPGKPGALAFDFHDDDQNYVIVDLSLAQNKR